MLKGHVQIYLNEKKVHEGWNALTGYPNKAMNEGDFRSLMLASKKYPIRQWFSGCILTDGANSSDLSNMMISHSSNIVGVAGDGYAPSGTKRGSFSSSSGYVSTQDGEGWRFIFDFSPDQAIGTINSVCLTRPFSAIAMAELSASALTDDDFYESLSDSVSDEYYAPMMIIDYGREVGYDLSYESGVITVRKYILDTKVNHIWGQEQLGIVSYTDYTIDLTGGTIPTNVSSYFGTSLCSFSYTGDEIHCICFNYSNSKTTLDDVVIPTASLASGTYSINSREYADVNVVAFENTASKDGIIVDKTAGYYYAVARVSNVLKMVKLSMSADTATEWQTIPSVLTSTTYFNQDSLVLPNGDMIKSGYGTSNGTGLYYHAGTWYPVKFPSLSNSYRNLRLHGNAYGSALMCHYQNTKLLALPPYVSTIYDLQNPVTKLANQSMRVTYDILEANS